MEVAPGVRRLGTSILNWHLIVEDGKATVVDAGLPRYAKQLGPELRTAGLMLADVEAVILTHAHADHVGVAEKLRKRGVPVFVHREDEQLARSVLPFGEKQSTLLPYLRYGGTFGLLGHITAQGGMIPRPIHEVRTFGDGDILDVPGKPRVVATPGHTAGHSSFLLEGRALLVGDALCTLNPLTRVHGPQVLPRAFAVDAEQQLSSLDALVDLDAPTVLFGHGEPWMDGIASAVAAARSVGPT